MSITKHTKVTQPLEDSRGSSVVVDNECYIKSTVKSSTWGTHADPDTSSFCDNGNLISSSNIDHEITGVYNRTNPLVKFTGDWSSVLDLVKNPYYDTSSWPPTFSYSRTIDRSALLKFFSTKPHGFYYQVVIRFKTPIDIPPKSTIKWSFTPEVHNGTHGGMKGEPGKFLYPAWSPHGEQGGIYAVENLNQIKKKRISWKHNTCGGMDHWVRDVKNSVQYVEENGLKGVTTMISQMVYGGCAGWNKTRFNATLVECTIIPSTRILVEGEDF